MICLFKWALKEAKAHYNFLEKDKNETAAERIALQRFCFLDSFAFDAGGQQIQPSVCRRALRPFGGQWEPFAEKSGTNAGGYGILVTEGGCA